MQHKIQDVNFIIEFGEQENQTNNTYATPIPWIQVAIFPRKYDGSHATPHIHHHQEEIGW